ncbi:MAG: ferrochelatase [Verrucomicrobiota bacterium]|jgi:protoporphyrin/coproporphyrin ferrochelatase
MNQPGVLLINLGSPDSPSVRDVRKYLREFLMDGRVMDLPYAGRFILVHGMILPFRPKQSAEAYASIWSENGSPLIMTSRRVQRLLQQRMTLPVELAMRYQNPSIEKAIGQLNARGVDELLVIPLFPHYAMSSFETAAERAKEVARKLAPEMTVRIVSPYYNDPAYIRALVQSAQDFLAEPYDHLLFSFHGIPERHLRKSDPTGCHCLQVENCCAIPSPAHATCYRAQCFRTVEAFVKEAGVTKYSIAFQSRLGRDPWLQPYTDQEILRLGRDGVKKLLVICPAFVSDCLETIEEIGMRGRESFHEASGGELKLIPCLNDHPLWIDALEGMVARYFPIQQTRPAEVDRRPVAATVS